MINQLRRAAAIVRQHVSLVASSTDGRRLVRGAARAVRALAVDTSLAVLLAGVVAFAATRPTGAAPKAWYYAGGGYGGYGGYGLGDAGLPIAWGCFDPNDQSGVTWTRGQGPFVRLATGRNHAIALHSDGTVSSWGGPAGASVPDDLGVCVDIAAGGDSSAVIRSDGRLRAWGPASAYLPHDDSSYRDIAVSQGECGADYVVAVSADGVVTAWGLTPCAAGYLEVPADLGSCEAVAAGRSFAMALTEAGSIRAWGSTGAAQVPQDLGVCVAIAAGDATAYAIESDGDVRAWGNLDYFPPDLGPCVEIAASGYSGIALRADGSVRAWGPWCWGTQQPPQTLGKVVEIAMIADNRFIALHQPDCDLDGESDIAELPIGDEDRDGTIDACEIAAGAADCNGDDVLDELQFRREIARSQEFSSREFGSSGRFHFAGVRPCPADGTVEIALDAGAGDFGSGVDGGEYLRVWIAGTELLISGSKTATTASVVLPAQEFNSWIDLSRQGRLEARFESGPNVDWGSLSHRVSLRYLDGQFGDCNGNGLLDLCDVSVGGSSADCDDNQVPDSCQVSYSPEVVEQYWSAGGNSGVIEFVPPATALAGTEVLIRIYGSNSSSIRLEALGRVGTVVCYESDPIYDWCYRWQSFISLSAAEFNSFVVAGGPIELLYDSQSWGSLNASVRYFRNAPADVNWNQVPDSCDIASGLLADCNGNEVPDQVETGEIDLVAAAPFALACNGASGAADASTLRIRIPRHARSDRPVTISLSGQGDLDRGPDEGEFLACSVAGQTIVLSGGQACDTLTATAVIAASELNAAIDSDGYLSAVFIAGAESDCGQCPIKGWLRIEFAGIDGSVDCNFNGRPDGCDPDSDGDGTPDGCVPPDVDTDGDGVLDSVDSDDDNDGVPDSADAFPLDAGESSDTDGDGIGNNADTNDDNDAVEDGADNCPGVANDDQANLDNDAEGDACDLDDDNDGVADAVDNCPTTPNAPQTDCDGNGVGDACDAGTTAGGPNLLVDGGFEASDFNGSYFGPCYTSGGFAMSGWQHGTARNEDLYLNLDTGDCYETPVNPEGGQYLLALQGSGCCNCNVNGAIWQQVTTEADRTYTVRLQVYLDQFDAIRVSYGSQSVTFAPPAIPEEQWTDVSWIVQGGGTAELRIESIGTTAAPGCLERDNAFVDNVSMSRDALVIDCNGNGQQDLEEIGAGTASDCNSNCTIDACEPDSDDDGVTDDCDACPGKPGPGCDGCPANECGGCGNPSDLDGDGYPDCVDPDDDGDGAADDADAFPNDPSESRDTDGDGIGDNADADDDNDGIPDDADNCDRIVNPGQQDCDGNGVGDVCDLAANPSLDCDGDGVLDACNVGAGAPDCDADGIPDSCELADGAADCNLNGVPDACDIANYVLEDCNENGVGDTCEKQLWVELDSGVMAPFGGSQPKLWTIESAVQAVENVEIVVLAKGDFSAQLEYVDFEIPGYTRRISFGVDCALVAQPIDLTPDVFNAAIRADGTIPVRLRPSVAVDAGFCGGNTWAKVTLSYRGAASTDCNANGVIDSCEIEDGISPDANPQNGVPDECEDGLRPCPPDYDLDGVVGGSDLGLLLSNWGTVQPYYDLDGNGLIEGADLGLLLSAWGTCAE